MHSRRVQLEKSFVKRLAQSNLPVAEFLPPGEAPGVALIVIRLG
jgi:hypothetical protein